MGLMAAPSLVPRVNLDLQKTGKHHETPGLPEHLRHIQRLKRTLLRLSSNDLTLRTDGGGTQGCVFAHSL
jgi:hypothetical protein